MARFHKKINISVHKNLSMDVNEQLLDRLHLYDYMIDVETIGLTRRGARCSWLCQYLITDHIIND